MDAPLPTMQREMGRRHTKTVVDVVIVGIVPVAKGATSVRFIIVERTAPQNTAFPMSPVTKGDACIIQPKFFINVPPSAGKTV